MVTPSRVSPDRVARFLWHLTVLTNDHAIAIRDCGPPCCCGGAVLIDLEGIADPAHLKWYPDLLQYEAE